MAVEVIDANADSDGLPEKTGAAAAATLKTVAKGLDKGCDIYADHLIDLISDPKNTIASDLAAPLRLAQAAFSTAFTYRYMGPQIN